MNLGFWVVVHFLDTFKVLVVQAIINVDNDALHIKVLLSIPPQQVVSCPEVLHKPLANFELEPELFFALGHENFPEHVVKEAG